MITNIPFEIARDIAHFELHKDLPTLTENSPTGSPVRKMKAVARLKEYKDRSKAIFDFGLEKAELKNILEDFKTNPISLKSCGGVEKQSFMIAEMEQLLIGDYVRRNSIVR